MDKVYVLKHDELEMVKKIYDEMTTKEGYESYRETIMSKEGLNIVHIYIELMFNKSLKLVVPDEYEFPARSLASSKCDVIRAYNSYMFKLGKDMKNEEYREHYRHVKFYLNLPMYPGKHTEDMIHRINPHHEISENEMKNFRLEDAWVLDISSLSKKE